MKERWSAASQRVSVCAFAYPSFLDQLLGNYRNRAALKAGVAGQISSRDWLMATNQVQHDTTIDIACRFTSGNLKVSEINLSHLETPAWRGSRLFRDSVVNRAMPTYLDSRDEENRKYAGY